jgi:hypothetical protein
MSVSDRYRALVDEATAFVEDQTKAAGAEPADEVRLALKALRKGVDVLAELREGVGEVPRIRLELELTPVLLKAHNHIDRGRLDFLAADCEKPAAAAWDLQQSIYRLLNDL